MNSIGKKLAAFVIAAAMLVALAGCSGQPLSTREKGTGIGALVGAGTGAIIGAAVGAPGAGAAIGGALGAGTGFVVGNAMQNQEAQTKQTQSQLQSQQSEIEQQRRDIERLKSQSETE
ncbi:MAG TPA: glycine zipper domain-containing protein [Candidatus Binataceae bacterium]|jgi:phage tail tape-measure protein|nr:glycine zipper domain-containing protein [Candidatus Binataceae bacterium]